jgi:inner membrane protein involved in colicin E2 resistance
MFNLSKYQNKYPGLLSEDVDILQKYLSDEKFTDFFEELVQYNKKNKTVKYGILLFIILLAMVFLFL